MIIANVITGVSVETLLEPVLVEKVSDKPHAAPHYKKTVKTSTGNRFIGLLTSESPTGANEVGEAPALIRGKVWVVRGRGRG